MRTVLLNLQSFTERTTLLQIATVLSMLINCLHIFTFKNLPISMYHSNQRAYRVAYMQLVETYLGAAARVGSWAQGALSREEGEYPRRSAALGQIPAVSSRASPAG